MKRILIVGGGFVGLRTARLLAKRADVTLVSNHPRFTFTPWLVDLLSGDMKLEDMTADIGEIAKKDGFTFVLGTVVRVDREHKRAMVEIATGAKEIEYDAVAFCHGASTNYFNIPGAEEHTLQIKTPEHVELLKKRLASHQEPVSVCVVGAGPTGVEAVFAVLDQLKHMNRKGKVFLLQAAPTILPGFSKTLIENTRRHLKAEHVEIMEGDPAIRVTENGVDLKSGKKVGCQMVIWAGGIKPNHVEILPTLPSDVSGNISVERSLEVTGEIFAAGDVCSIQNPSTPTPKTAQVAMAMAPMLAENLMREINSDTLKPFEHHSKGVIITAGHTALLEEGKISLSSPLFHFVRYVLYRYRFWQMTGR